jgi:hypothetical protein
MEAYRESKQKDLQNLKSKQKAILPFKKARTQYAYFT